MNFDTEEFDPFFCSEDELLHKIIPLNFDSGLPRSRCEGKGFRLKDPGESLAIVLFSSHLRRQTHDGILDRNRAPGAYLKLQKRVFPSERRAKSSLTGVSLRVL